MKARLGKVSPEMIEWWTRLFAGNSSRVVAGVMNSAEGTDVSALLPKIKVPTLTIGGESDLLAFGDAVKKWQKLIPDCEVVVLPGNSYHVAATEPNACVSALMDFLKRHPVKG